MYRLQLNSASYRPFTVGCQGLAFQALMTKLLAALSCLEFLPEIMCGGASFQVQRAVVQMVSCKDGVHRWDLVMSVNIGAVPPQMTGRFLTCS